MDALALGLSLGLGAGLAPGPLLALVIRSTLQRGAAAGAWVALSPLVTDAPIILVAVLLASELPEAALGALGLAGGLFVLWLALEALREAPEPVEAAAAGRSARRDVRRGALTNLLSPHPWMFWITVGAPILAGGGAGRAAVFLVTFYVLLVGSKAAVAAALGAGRERLLTGRGYGLALRGSALGLLAAGLVLLYEGAGTVAG